MGRSMRIHGWSSEAHGLKGILAFAPDSFGAPRQTIITIFAQQLLDAENADDCRLLGWVRKDWDTAIHIVTMSATRRILHAGSVPLFFQRSAFLEGVPLLLQTSCFPRSKKRETEAKSIKFPLFEGLKEQKSCVLKSETRSAFFFPLKEQR